MKLSMIMTTQGNREDELKRFLESLKKQKNVKLELILVDQTNDNKVQIILEEIILPCTVKHIKAENMSLSKARNIGLQKASGDIICFPDDDCWYEDNILEKIICKFAKFMYIDIICFNVFDPLTNSYYGKNREKLHGTKKITLFNIFRIPISIGIFIKIKSGDKLIFDEELGAGCKWGSGEETDLLIRLYNKSYNIMFTNEINIFHPNAKFDVDEINKNYRYGLGFGATIAKAVKESRKNIPLYYEYLNVLIRSILGMIVFIHKDKNKYQIYRKRYVGVISGYKQYNNLKK